MRTNSLRKMSPIGGLALAAAFLLAPFTSEGGWRWWRDRTSDQNLVEKLESLGSYSTLLTALELTGLKETVAEAEALTLFAPTDDAFGKLPEGTIEFLIDNPEALSNILLYHVVGGSQKTSALLHQTSVTTLQGNPVIVAYEHWRPTVNGIGIEASNIRASNGYIQSIGDVLLPPDEDIVIENLFDLLVADGRFTTLVTALELTDLDEAVKGGEALTIFAPTDDAFDALPEGTLEALIDDTDTLTDILLYHVLGEAKDIRHLLYARSATTLLGPEVTIALKNWQILINDSKVVSPNLNAPNGVIQAIDAVLLPPSTPMTIIDLLEDDGRFSILLTALELTGLTGALEGVDPLTVLAPTDEAFAALPDGVLEGLINDPDALTDILLYHVIPGDRDLHSLREERQVETLLGENVRVWNWSKYYFINRSYVLDRDLTAENGRVHAIYRVLIP